MDARAAINGIQEVSGSIPLISTKKYRNLTISVLFLSFFVNNQFLFVGAIINALLAKGGLKSSLKFSPFNSERQPEHFSESALKTDGFQG